MRRASHLPSRGSYQRTAFDYGFLPSDLLEEFPIKTEKLCRILDRYDRCMEYYINSKGQITAKSGRYPHWRRFQRDFHGPTINIQHHGYAMEHVHHRTMIRAEAEADPNVDYEEYLEQEYNDRPTVCIVTLTPIARLVQEGREGARTRA